MRRRTVITETLDDGPEIEFEFEPIDDTILQRRVADMFVVAYVVQDDGCGCNPLKDYDGNGTLYTLGERVITDDERAPGMLGLNDFDQYNFDPNLECDGVNDLVRMMVSEKIMKDEELRVWAVKLRLELDCDPMIDIIDAMQGYRGIVQWSDEDNEMFEKLGDYTEMAKEAWIKLYEQGKIGEYLAVPVRYRDSCHGPGTTRIYTTRIDDCNAVWVPGKNEIENMNFEGHETYLEKLAVAARYAKNCLEEYEKWCNGEVYGCIVEVFDKSGKKIDAREDEGWGFIGAEWAERALNGEFFDPVCERIQKNHDEAVRTGSGHQKEMTL